MKKLFPVILIAVMFAMPATGQRTEHAMLKLRLSDGAPLSVNINGQFINRNTAILRLDGLEAGRHKVEVYRNRANNRRPKRIFTGTISLDPGQVYVGLVDLHTRRLRMKIRPYDPIRDGTAASAAPSGEADNPGAGFGSFPEGRDEPRVRPDFSANPVPAGVLTAARMATLEKQVSAKVTESDRLRILKSNLMNAKISVAQLDRMLSWLSFESTRLELIEWIRPRVADREHLPQLAYRFTLEENRAAFQKQLDN